MNTFTQLPIPGAWVDRARVVLDQLAAMVSADQVIAEFGSLATVVYETLGHVNSGGAGTKAAVRATGRLFQHRLGPALATEALSWAASVSQHLDPASIATFLESGASAEVVYRPIHLDHRDDLVTCFERQNTEKGKLAALTALWESLHEPMFAMPPSNRLGNSELETDEEHDVDYLVEWLRAHLDAKSKHEGDAASQLQALPEDPAVQVKLFEELTEVERMRFADFSGLFDLCDEIVGQVLVEFPARVLDNPQCPQALQDRVRYPHDRATLELALSAGAGYYEAAKVRRILASLTSNEHNELLTSMPVPYLRARRRCGLATAHDLIEGPLSNVDLADRSLSEAVLGTYGAWLHRSDIDNLVEVLIHHPQASELTWLARSIAGSHHRAQELAAKACDEIADVALTYTHGFNLTVDHAQVAIRNGDYWISRCPGIAAMDHPELHLAQEIADLEGGRQFGQDDDDSDYVINHDVPFSYPEAIWALQGSYREAPGWEVSLPTNGRELVANANWMGNCTGSYVGNVLAGRAYILIVSAPNGERYNVEIRVTRGRYRVRQINSRYNGEVEPSWVRRAVQDRLHMVVRRHQVGYRVPAPIGRKATDRRDRRRARARRRSQHGKAA